MSNNKGQVLIIFVLVLPVLIFILGYVIDIATIGYEKNRLTNLADLVLEEDDISDMKQIVAMNDSEVDININEQNGTVIIELHKRIKSMFGKIIGQDFYDLKVEREK